MIPVVEIEEDINEWQNWEEENPFHDDDSKEEFLFKRQSRGFSSRRGAYR